MNKIEASLACGTASLGNLYRPIDHFAAQKLLEGVWDLGYRHFDTAPFYGFGLSERRLGNFLQTKKSDEYVISTKVGRILQLDPSYHQARDHFIDALPFRPVYDYSYDGIMKSVEHSFQRLGIEKIDILYMHDLGRFVHGSNHKEHMKIAMSGGYKALSELKDTKVVDKIGIGVNEYEVCEEAMEYGEWDYFLLAGRYTLLEQEAVKTFFPKCQERKSKIILGGVYNSGILATGSIKGAKFNYEDAPQEIIDKVRLLEKVCKEYSITLAQAAIQFPLHNKVIEHILVAGQKIDRFEFAQESLKKAIPKEFWQDLIDQGLILDENLYV